MNNRAVKNTASLAMLGGTLLVFFGATFFLISSNLLVDENDDNFKNDISSFEIPTSIVTELGIQKVVHDYLKETIAISSFGDEVFCSFEVLGSDQKEDRLNLYLWTLCSELYLAEGKIILTMSSILFKYYAIYNCTCPAEQNSLPLQVGLYLDNLNPYDIILKFR